MNSVIVSLHIVDDFILNLHCDLKSRPVGSLRESLTASQNLTPNVVVMVSCSWAIV